VFYAPFINKKYTSSACGDDEYCIPILRDMRYVTRIAHLSGRIVLFAGSYDMKQTGCCHCTSLESSVDCWIFTCCSVN